MKLPQEYSRDYICDLCGRRMYKPHSTLKQTTGRTVELCVDCLTNPNSSTKHRLFSMRENCLRAYVLTTGHQLYPDQVMLLITFGELLDQTEILLGRRTWFYEQYDLLQTFLTERGFNAK